MCTHRYTLVYTHSADARICTGRAGRLHVCRACVYAHRHTHPTRMHPRRHVLLHRHAWHALLPVCQTPDQVEDSVSTSTSVNGLASAPPGPVRPDLDGDFDPLLPTSCLPVGEPDALPSEDLLSTCGQVTALLASALN